ncbi:hypothetical protein AWENTII_009187 [Aspergillus wentii]
MEPEKDKESKPMPFSEDEKRLRAYGRLPRRGELLGRHSKERTYFDSGDYALSATDKLTDVGAIHTGAAYPRRESISLPYAAVPNTSNAVPLNSKLIPSTIKRHNRIKQTRTP